MSKPWEHATVIRTWVDSPAGENRLQVLQIICGSLMLGAITLVMTFLVIAPFFGKDEDPSLILGGIAGFFSICSGLVAQFFWKHLAHGQKPGTAPELVVNQVMSQWIVVMSLVEGPCLLCCILFLVSQSDLEKGILLGIAFVLLALMAWKFPTRSKLIRAMGGSE